MLWVLISCRRNPSQSLMQHTVPSISRACVDTYVNSFGWYWRSAHCCCQRPTSAVRQQFGFFTVPKSTIAAYLWYCF